ncbi:MAG: maleylpyruvate isomerase family mycothiol-dependent enzyme [Pseudonocardiaceae bacterium]|nr:maleylpyruvate isomerase family mycothiol-dependent enzyme [Pseudonocardiaceae bacterium]
MTDIRQAIARQRGELATVLSGLSAARWDAPSLCAGWQVREVVAHIVMPFRYSVPRFVLELAKARGNFNRMADRCARRDAERLSTDELVATLRGNVNHPWKPPGGGLAGALSHDVIHGLDITVALGVDRHVPPEWLRIILGSLTAKNVRFFGVDLDGVALRADDLDWSYGSGVPLFGTAEDLLLVLCGRKLPAGRLRGEPSRRFIDVTGR